MGRRALRRVQLGQAWVSPPRLSTLQALTVVERLGPCQQPVPCSYFMALNLSCSGPAQVPQVLQETQGAEGSAGVGHQEEEEGRGQPMTLTRGWWESPQVWVSARQA